MKYIKGRTLAGTIFAVLYHKGAETSSEGGKGERSGRLEGRET
jgi:hypothetical protein